MTSTSPKNTPANETKIVIEEKVTMPEQKKVPSGDFDAVTKAFTADNMIDALTIVEDKLADGVNVRIQVAEDGTVSLEAIEDGKLKKFAGKAKGLYSRNKPLFVAGGIMLGTSLLLKVISNMQNNPIEDDVEITTENDPETGEVTSVTVTNA
jgi:hypothetical protein